MSAPDDKPFYTTSGSLRWPFRTTRDLVFFLAPVACDYYVRASTTGKLLAVLEATGKLRIFAGYHFDGATCAPDLEKMMRAVVLHDLLCQATTHRLWPISRKLADRYFLRFAQLDGAPWARLYHAGVRLFGGLHRLLRPPKPDEGVIVTLAKIDTPHGA